jgi:hypothetical protein
MMSTTLSLRRRASLATLAALGMALFAFAAPASAGHDDDRGQAACALHAAGACLPSCGQPHLGPYARRQYDKGYEAGAKAGREQGYCDGLSGRKFCDIAVIRQVRHSRSYNDGFRDGYAKAYEDAFRKAERECHRPGWNRGNDRGRGWGFGIGRDNWRGGRRDDDRDHDRGRGSDRDRGRGGR